MPRAPVLLGIAGIAMLGGDVRAGFDVQAEVITAREAERRQARAMAKFLRWQFADGATVVVQTPGMLPYFLRMPTVDLRGLSHTGPTDQAAMQALDPEVMIPLGKIVANEPVRLRWPQTGTGSASRTRTCSTRSCSRETGRWCRFTPPGSTCTCANPAEVSAEVDGHLRPRGGCACRTEKKSGG